MNGLSPVLSVVVPAYNEVESLPELVERIDVTVAKMKDPSGVPLTHEILIVDDGSEDGTADFLRDRSVAAPHLRGIILRRNQGKAQALMVGFLKARGKVVVTMDADLQDNPEDIPLLLEKLWQDFDLVSGARARRNDSTVRRLGSKVFNWAVRRSSGLSLRDMNCGFKAYRIEVVRSIVVYGQFHRYIPLLAHFNGFKVSEVQVGNSPRKYGTSKYPAFRYQGLLDLMSILFTSNYNLSPLHFFAKVSSFFLIPSALYIIYITIRYLLGLFGIGADIILLGRPSISVSLTFFLVGVNIFLTGFVCDFILHHLIRSRLDVLRHVAIHEEVDELKGSNQVETDV